jgi:hypothetical protein
MDLKEKMAKMKAKKMSSSQEKMAGKHMTNPPKYGMAMKPSKDTSGGYHHAIQE